MSPAQSQQTGSVTGRVTLTSRMRGIPISSNGYATRSVGRQAVAPVAPEMSSVVLYLSGFVYHGALAASRVQIRQGDEAFSPRVVAITRGSTVDFPNFDPFFHNVFSLSRGGTFDLGRYRTGETRSRTFTQAGLVKVYCHIHSHMSASILVLDHPFFSIPAADGAFTITGIPPGDYSLVGWHERVGEHLSTITVVAGRPSLVDVSLPVLGEGQ
jgi:plastocyanin